jgi:hypothetical protein
VILHNAFSRILCCSAILALVPLLLHAQSDTTRDASPKNISHPPAAVPPASPESTGADTTEAPQGENRFETRSDRLPDTDSLDAGSPVRRTLPSLREYASWYWKKDSLTLLTYQRFSDIAAMHPYALVTDLGNLGQPHGILAASSLPQYASLNLNGLPFDDFLTAAPPTDMLPLEDAATITVYPQYQSFWYGAPGDVFAAGMEQKEWDAPRPVTRLRHAEAANEYLFTDAMFTLNPSASGNLFLAGTRMTIGGAARTNTARFENNLVETWNLRARYRERISSLLTASLALRYNDELTYLNGGVAGTFDSLRRAYRYEEIGTGDFSSIAFDPITATLVNATMQSHRQRYTATAELAAFWTDDSSQTTRIRVHAVSDVRRFRDNLSDLDEGNLVPASYNLTDHWTRYYAQLDHRTSLPWAHLTLKGHVARFAADKGGGTLSEDGLETGARGRLDLLLGPVTLSGFAALDYRYDQTAVSLGAGGELPLGALSLWGGLSFSPRIRSFLSTKYRPLMLIVSGDRTPDLDKVSIAEGGLRVRTRTLELDLRGFIRREDRYLLLQSTPYGADITGRYVLISTSIPGGAVQTVSGGSLTANLALWRFRLDQQTTYQRSESTHPLLTHALSPELHYNGSLYFRGNLIEGTLDLKAGASFTYSSSYQPLTYLPEAGIFTLPAELDDGARSYTEFHRVDLFLFATIKQRATLSVVLYNALNSEYITAAFYPMYDRALRIGVDWVFFD